MSASSSSRIGRNNFDLLRLLFAATVCLVHAHELSGFFELAWVGRLLSSAVAVKAFFVVGGFLVFMSHERSASLGFAAISSRDLAGYFSWPWLKYVVANLVFLNFLQPTLPGVFEANKLAVVNGALWTLKIEAMFYLCVQLFVWLFRRYSRWPLLLLVYGASVAYAGSGRSWRR